MLGGTLLIPLWLKQLLGWRWRPSDSAELDFGLDGTVRLRDEEDDDEDEDKDKKTRSSRNCWERR